MVLDSDIERIETLIAQVRLKDSSVEWRSACDEVMDEIRRVMPMHPDKKQPTVPAAKRKVRIVAAMFGGIVENIYKDHDEVDVDVVFTEYGKYVVEENSPEIKKSDGRSVFAETGVVSAVDDKEHVEKVFETVAEHENKDPGYTPGV